MFVCPPPGADYTKPFVMWILSFVVLVVIGGDTFHSHKSSHSPQTNNLHALHTRPHTSTWDVFEYSSYMLEINYKLLDYDQILSVKHYTKIMSTGYSPASSTSGHQKAVTLSWSYMDRFQPITDFNSPWSIQFLAATHTKPWLTTILTFKQAILILLDEPIPNWLYGQHIQLANSLWPEHKHNTIHNKQSIYNIGSQPHRAY